MKHRFAALLAALLSLTAIPALAQNVPANSVQGRLGIPAQGGPVQAIPFATLSTNLLNNLGFTPGSVFFASGAGGMTQNNTGLFWDNNAKKLGIGINASLPSALSVRTNDGQQNFFGNGNANTFQVMDGSNGTPVTAINSPTAVIARRESVGSGGGDGSGGAALLTMSYGDGITQNVGIVSSTISGGVGDTVGLYGRGEARGTGGAFGVFGIGVAAAANTSVFGGNFVVQNDRGSSAPYFSDFTGHTGVMAVDIAAASQGGLYYSSVGINMRAGAGTNEKFDVGLGFQRLGGKSPTITADIQSDSDATTILLANSGSHQDGINLTGGGSTYSGSAWKSPGASIGGTGAITGTTYNIGSTNVLAISGNYTILKDASGFASVTAGNASDQTNYLDNTATSFRSRNGGATTFAKINASSWNWTNIAAPSTPASGTGQLWVDSSDKILKVKNDLGNTTITVAPDAGATNNFLTGITTGGAITKAQPAASNLSNGVTGSGAVVLANAPAFTASPTISGVTGNVPAMTSGTFTPVITFGGGSTGVTYTTQIGRYQKISNGSTHHVFFNIVIVLSSKGSSTGTLSVGGLPFNAINVANNYQSVNTYVGGVGSTLNGHWQAGVTPGTSAMFVQYLSSGNTVGATDADVTNGLTLFLHGSYESAS